jgi:hypothetical protein
MKIAGDFLSKFQKLAPPNDALRRAVATAVSSVIGKEIPKGSVKIQHGVAFIDVPSIAKNKIRIERKVILDLLYEKIPKAKDSVRDIR